MTTTEGGRAAPGQSAGGRAAPGPASPGRVLPVPPVVPVLLTGGSGSRLWPLSRRSYPKQFALKGDGSAGDAGPEATAGDRGAAPSLFQSTVLRLSGRGFARPVVLTAEAFRFIVTEQLGALGCLPELVLIEPEPRNTAPAVLAAALWLCARNPETLMLVAPSDHLIPDAAAFRAAVQQAAAAARAGRIVTFGIRPDRPETGFGWLEPGPAAEPGPQTPPDSPLRPLLRFVEKPDAATAAAMLAGGRHLWNAGLVLASAETLVAAFRDHAPDLCPPVAEAVAGAEPDLGFHRLAAAPWARARDVSLDYAVLERAANLWVMPYDGAWSDLGGWDAVWRAGGAGGAEGAGAGAATAGDGVVTAGHATAIDCRDTLLLAEGEGLALVGLGLSDIVAVAMPDAVLVARRDRAQDVRLAVAALESAGRPQATAFPRAHRPWGWFETLARGERFQVKRITVHPGGQLSRQSHLHRAEHWVVVAGAARVSLGERVLILAENQSIYVPQGEVHRLENPGRLPLTLIEVQTGSYLGEDDITRYEDAYRRG